MVSCHDMMVSCHDMMISCHDMTILMNGWVMVAPVNFCWSFPLIYLVSPNFG